jgi:predicted DNA-binding transcriptional regulator YafY
VNRTDRLYAIAEELRRAGARGRSAGKLAATFEVTARTIKRDVSALQQAGLPVWARVGAGGGYVLDAAASLPPVNFTSSQAVAVALALAARPPGPFAGDGQAALGKVLDVMDSASRRRAEALAGRLWIRERAQPPATAALRAVEAALARRVVVALHYRDAAGRRTRRRVEPHLLACDRDVWYLIGWCRERDAVRWFRWDRIEAAHLTTEAVTDRAAGDFGVPPPDAHPVGLTPASASPRPGTRLAPHPGQEPG